MSTPWRGVVARNEYEPAMTFVEIAEALGIPISTVQLTYNTAMYKLTLNPGGLERMRKLIEMRRELQDAPSVNGLATRREA